MTPKTQLRGLLGEALEANLRGRLSHFIVDEHSPAIRLFDPDQRRHHHEGDWYGEHAGKWLVAAAKAAARSGDATLRARVLRVAGYLVSTQEDDGYLGTYAPDRRFMRRQPPRGVTWDGAPRVRTWDIWTHAYMILGLVEVHRQLDAPRCLEAARRIGDLCLETLGHGGIDITELGNHFGMSATVLMDPAVELHFATGDARYLDLALRILQQANADPHLALLDRALEGADASAIGTGKAYQLIWNMGGVAKLARATGDARYLAAAENVWSSIRRDHLTLGGGPWGGVALRSREIFNPQGVFSPQGYVETCSSLAWIELNAELWKISGQARYIEEIERTAYNDLLGAQAPNGEDWCYYVFPNGRRVHTTYWRCCKSSGAMALEMLPRLAYAQPDETTIAVNLYGPGEAQCNLRGAGAVHISQHTAYPADGGISLRVDAEHAARFRIRLRIPAWAENACIEVSGEAMDARADEHGYAGIERMWQPGDELRIRFAMRPRLHRAVNRNVQESRAPDGSEVRQEVLHFEYAAITCGPWVFATELIDGFKTDETLRLPQRDDAVRLTHGIDAGDGLPVIVLDLDHRVPLTFRPWFAVGGRADGAWRLTWLSLAPEDRR